VPADVAPRPQTIIYETEAERQSREQEQLSPDTCPRSA